MRSDELPVVTWTQAGVMNWWPAGSFQAVGLNPATVRKWASRGLFHPVAIGPKGCVLYRYEHVMQAANRRVESQTCDSDENVSQCDDSR